VAETEKRLLKIALALAGVIVAAAAGIVLYGASLPVESSFLRAMQLAQPPEAAYSALADLERHPAWRPDVRSFTRQGEKDGKEVWRVTDQHGNAMDATVELNEAPKRLLLRFEEQGGLFSVSWEFVVGPIPGGSMVTLRERARIANPFYRGVNRLLFGTKFADDCLANLAKKFGQEAVIM
jgi:hypothetical protein